MEAKKRKPIDNEETTIKNEEAKENKVRVEEEEETMKKNSKELLNEIKELTELIETKNKEIEDLKYKNASLINRFNANKVALQREKEMAITKAKEDFILNLIVLLQNFERALNHMSGIDNNVIIGIRMIYKQMKNLLNEEGLTEIIPNVGEPFDPFTTEVSETRVTGEFDDMSIIEVVEKGFSLNGKIIKPSKVIVAMRPAETKETEDQDGQEETD